MEKLSDNQVARGIGQLTYTQMLNDGGGIECDFTVTRLSDDRFRVVTGTAFGQHDLAWIRDHAPDDGSVQVGVPAYACAGVGRRPGSCALDGDRSTLMPFLI
jgi:4-methylaminobutanoate oxidase (formaldehyde-forming)